MRVCRSSQAYCFTSDARCQPESLCRSPLILRFKLLLALCVHTGTRSERRSLPIGLLDEPPPPPPPLSSVPAIRVSRRPPPACPLAPDDDAGDRSSKSLQPHARRSVLMGKPFFQLSHSAPRCAKYWNEQNKHTLRSTKKPEPNLVGFGSPIAVFIRRMRRKTHVIFNNRAGLGWNIRILIIQVAHCGLIG